MKTKVLFYLGLFFFFILNSCSTNRVVHEKIVNDKVEIDKVAVTYLSEDDKRELLNPREKFFLDSMRVLIVGLTTLPSEACMSQKYSIYSDLSVDRYLLLRQDYSKERNFSDITSNWRLKYHSKNPVLRDTIVENPFYAHLVIKEVVENISSKSSVFFLKKSLSGEKIDSIVKSANIDLVITLDSICFKYIFDYSGYKQKTHWNYPSSDVPGNTFAFIQRLSNGFVFDNIDSFGAYVKDASILKHTVRYDTVWDLLWVNKVSKGVSKKQRIEQSNTLVYSNNPIFELVMMNASTKSGNDFAFLFK